MYQQILEKMKIIECRKPYSSQVRKELKKMECCELIYTSLHMDGSIVTKEQVSRILAGEFVVEASLNDHASIEHYVETLLLMESLLGMDNEISLRVIEEIHDVSQGGEGQIYRRSNPILFTLDYNPPHWQEVNEKLNEFIKWTYDAEEHTKGNEILKAALIHNKLIEIYPFASNSEATARFLLYYSLMTAGFPICELRLSEREYNTFVIEYLKNHKVENFYKALERSIFNKLEVMLQITDAERE